ncbi:hypothetical protein MYX65_03180 [Acidobacteria bacterium AH-259-L09]|nr:hypothetical protein [Acidobacteria bacterium AH-259-L09]
MKNAWFAVIAKTERYHLDRLKFAELIDTLVAIYEDETYLPGKKFTLDTQEELGKLKRDHRRSKLSIVQYEDEEKFNVQFFRLLADDEPTVITECADDVTKQVLDAFQQKVYPEVKHYAQECEKLIKEAWKVFIEAGKWDEQH